MKLIVGLGNPGKEYENTRHNFGFMVVDKMAEKYNAYFKLDKKLKAEIADTNIEGEKIFLVKPSTYMNLTGEAVLAIKNYYKIDTRDIWVVFDDIDLELGRIRVRTSGGTGGHKGLSSNIEKLATDEIVRFRLGIKDEYTEGLKAKDVVLQRFPKEKEQMVQETIEKCIEQIEKAIREGVEKLSL